MIEQELTELFQRLGARNPAAWAHSQVHESLPQLARFLFLREAWRLVVNDGNYDWISTASQMNSAEPGGDLGPAVARLLLAGCQEGDLTRVVRIMQWRLLSGLCLLLDDPGNLENEVGSVAWRLFQVDEDGHPTVPICGLIESVLETEPNGTEMRPKETS
jgi:hypothetical protein